jgi:dipeptidyl aminopeptidase/acylaminoacyl peptidase
MRGMMRRRAARSNARDRSARESGESVRVERPFGSWPTRFDAERITRGALRLGQPRLDDGRLYWLEGRPVEGGRQVVMRLEPGGAPQEATPSGVSVRTLVHEYGGGDYLVRGGRLFWVDFSDQRVWTHGPGGPRPLTPASAEGPRAAPARRFADFDLSPDGRWLAAVEERHRAGGEPENGIIAIAAGGGEARVAPVAAGHDFASSPRFARDGRRLVFTAWDHPNMPWDGTWLYSVDWGPDGPAGPPRRIAGGPSESIVQPGFSPAGVLTFVSDRSGFWNLWQLRAGGAVPLCPRDAEFARPPWVFGLSCWAFVAEDTILCRFGEGGSDRLARLHVPSGRLEPLALPLAFFEGVRVEGASACFVGASARKSAVYTLDLVRGALAERRPSLDFEPEAEALAEPEAVSFPSAQGRTAHAFLYRPVNPDARGPAGERPPLLVKSHGGPTSAASPALNLGIQYWTSRGFAVVDVNYGGSSGYGRAYRELLRGQWGVVDVEDCVHAALHLAREGVADAGRLAITGGSAGGYTTLCALTFHRAFAAGASHYGIGDLEALARDTHKFESRYLDGLVGPWPAARDVYVARSPIHFTHRLACPVVFFQGLEDRVVPPNQAEAMVAALAARGIPHAYVAFEGEQHGFRKAENQRVALDGELWFYAQVFGFEAEVSEAARERVRIVRPAPAGARAGAARVPG